MSRRHRRRPSSSPRDPARTAAVEQVESHLDGDWVVRRITGSAATRPYRCPGCDQEIRPATPHVVAWPAEPIAGGDGLDQRRHWHTGCWSARDRRGPARGGRG